MIASAITTRTRSTAFQRFISISRPVRGQAVAKVSRAKLKVPWNLAHPSRSRRASASPSGWKRLKYSIIRFSTFSGCYVLIEGIVDACPDRRRREKNGRTAQERPRGGEPFRQPRARRPRRARNGRGARL